MFNGYVSDAYRMSLGVFYEYFRDVLYEFVLNCERLVGYAP